MARALLDQGHLLHRTAARWLERELEHGWATCPITENGVVRIMAQPAYPNHQPAARVANAFRKPAGTPAMPSGLRRSALWRRA